MFLQDDWRIKPNLTLSYGLRYETQTNAHSKLDFAPRIAVAWSPGAANSAKPPKMVIRFGTGFFYNRFNENSTLQAVRFNGVNVIQTQVAEPFDKTVRPRLLSSKRRMSPPYIRSESMESDWCSECLCHTRDTAGSLASRSEPADSHGLRGWNAGRATIAAEHHDVRRLLQHPHHSCDSRARRQCTVARHDLRLLQTVSARTRPGRIFRYEASGQFNQRQFFVGFNSRLSRMFQLNGNYSLSKTTNDTDGQGGALFPMNSYDMSPASLAAALSTFVTALQSSAPSTCPGGKLVMNPFVVANTGPGFNITTGQDRNLDRQYNERPSFARANAVVRRRSGVLVSVNLILRRCRVKRLFREITARRPGHLSSTFVSVARLHLVLSKRAMLLPQGLAGKL